MNEPLTRDQGAAQLRDDLHMEGWNARLTGITVTHCPYSNTGQRDSHWGVNFAAEWLKGWRDCDARKEG